MLINFCDPRLLPRISSDKISSDGYFVENLVSSDFRQRSRGFLAEYFIKPPVAVTLAFPTNIEIYQIYIDPVVGSQKSTSFEIYTLSEKVLNSWILCNDTSERPDTSTRNISTSQLYVPVGKGNLGEPGSVLFHNKSYIINPIDKHELSAKYTFDLRHHKGSALNYVSHLKLRITRTTSGKTVAIKSIAVWGRPARLAAAKQVHRIYELWSPPVECTGNTAVRREIDSELDNDHSKHQVPSDRFTENGLEIPEDFMDSLTYEIMSMPILLPSGKNIDQSTLDKHIQTGSSRGNLPCDPFTGVVFDDNSRPLPNVLLKARLDKFILANSDTLSHIPKSLGRSENNWDNTNPNVSRLLEQKRTKESRSSCHATNYSKSNPPKLEYTSSVSSREKKFSLPKTTGYKLSSQQSLSRGIKRKASELDNLHTNSEDFLSERKNSSPHQSHPTLTSTGNHEDNLQSSLNSALYSTLSCLPSFTKTSSTKTLNDVEEFKNVCIKCGSAETLYRAPCNHLLCRNCLTTNRSEQNSDTVFDIKCCRTWNKHDFTRVH
ncbi:hypothetical protein FSP39_000329 [Pinctada imbricata]|uniref:U-box domain-containing protein n=1 Tax=Pinctada imbricata TaxID=66713 RepID=A0AA89C079_PINIB|nr:hypothetical protein FSP39_000329 [Pinctada imbricata]